MPTMEQAVAGYLKLRAMKKDLEAKHKEELAPINAKMDQLEAWLLRELDAAGALNVRTEAGTVYKTSRTSATVKDWEALLPFVRENEMWHLLSRAVAKSAVEEFKEAHGELPPGVSWTESVTIGVRTS